MPNPAAGFFGKLPSAGDFVQRRLPSGFVDVWDRHFESAVVESRSTLGSDWHEAYHASPVWRFLLAAGVCGESAWTGIMGPGVDRVGRCFPMVIAAPVAADVGSCTRVLTEGGDWFDAVEQVHAAAQLDAAISVDMFDEQIAALADPLDVPPPPPEFLRGIDWSAASHWRLPLPTGAAAASFLGVLWTRLAAASGHWCLWWTAGGERVPASVLVTNGLPQPTAYAGFLDASHSVAPWQSLGMFEGATPRRHAMPEAATSLVDVAVLSSLSAPAPAPTVPSVSWLPDDLELLSDLGVVSEASTLAVPVAHVAVGVVAEAPAADVTVLHRPDVALTLVTAEAGHPDRRQQAVAAVSAIARDLPGAGPAAGMQALRTRIMALNPRLRQASEDLIDPVLEDCAVIAAQIAGGHAGLLRIGTAAAWHWRHGRLQPFFASGAMPTQADAGGYGDFDDLLFSRAPLAAPGLGATAQPTCGEVLCAVEAGDRLLLMATQPLLQLPPDILARGLAMASCGDARLHIATAAGLGTDAARWPLAIIEIDA